LWLKNADEKRSFGSAFSCLSEMGTLRKDAASKSKTGGIGRTFVSVLTFTFL